MGYIAMARETFPETDKPFAMLSNFSSGIDPQDAKLSRGDGIPVLEGTLTGSRGVQAPVRVPGLPGAGAGERASHRSATRFASVG